MPVMPRSSHLDRRDQVAKEKKSQNEEMTDQQRFMRQAAALTMRQEQQQLVGPITFEERKQQRKKSLVLTEDELSEGVEAGTNSGKCFRYFFAGLVTVLLLFLTVVKMDGEVGIKFPVQLQRLTYTAQGLGGGVETVADASTNLGAATSAAASGSPLGVVVAPDLPERDQALLDSYLESLNLKRPVDSTSSSATSTTAGADDSDSDQNDAPLETPEQRIKRRRREDYEFKKALKVAHESKLADEQALTTTCGKSCQDKSNAMQLHYDHLTQQVTNELVSVAFENEVAAEAFRQNPGLIDPHQLRQTMEAKVKKLEEEGRHLEEGTEAKLDQQLEIAEVKEAYAILSNDASRRHYFLYATKPPEQMRHLSARDGGWGESLLLRTHYHKLILAWLRFLENSKVDSFVIFFVFVCVFLGPALAKLPQTVAMAQRMAEEWEEATERQKRAKKHQ